MTAWSPFAAGKGDFFRNVTLKSIDEKYGKSAAQIGLKHLVQRGIVVIPKTANKNRMAENIDIFDFQLSDEDGSQIAAFDKGKTLFGWY